MLICVSLGWVSQGFQYSSHVSGIWLNTFFLCESLFTCRFIAVAVCFSFALAIVSVCLSRFFKNQNQVFFVQNLYECGFNPFIFKSGGFFSLHYLRILLTFLVFDLEVLFLVPSMVTIKFFLLQGFFFIIWFI